MLIVSQNGEIVINHNQVKAFYIQYNKNLFADRFLIGQYANDLEAKRVLSEIAEQIIAGATLYEVK